MEQRRAEGHWFLDTFRRTNRRSNGLATLKTPANKGAFAGRR